MLNPLFFAGNSPKNFHEIYAEKTFSTKAWLPTMMIFEIITLIGMEGNSTTCIFSSF